MNIYENPIQGLNTIFNKILDSVVIKYSYLANPFEDLQMRRFVDGYMDAYYKRDIFELYKYDEEELRAVGITNPLDIAKYIADRYLIPDPFRPILLENKRKRIIDNYEEINEYYRMINGLPVYGDTEPIYVDYETCLKYGIDPTTPIHMVEKKHGKHVISILESSGYLASLINDNLDKEYLQYIGSKKIDVLKARAARNFDILYIDPSIDEEVLNIFLTLYEQCKNYFVKTIYIAEYSNIIEYYDRFIAMCIMVMTLQQFICRTIPAAINREFFNMYQVQALYSVYNIPFYAKLDPYIQRNICQSLNLLVLHKGTNKVIYDIATLLGFNRINIYKYYLMKEHRLDSKGNPIFKKKQKLNEDTGLMEEVYDYESMFDVYFQKVDVNDYDYHEALEDPTRRVEYESITSGDPYWIEDEPLLKEIYESEYNYKETKYLGITTAYSITDVMYDNVILMRMIIDMKKELSDLIIKIPSIVGGEGIITLFEAVVLCLALISKKQGLKGEIISKPSQILGVIPAIELSKDPYTGYHYTSAFNFDYFKDTNLDKSEMEEILSYMDDKEKAEFQSYIQTLTYPNMPSEEKIRVLNALYDNIKNLSAMLFDRMSKTNDIEEYRALRRFYQTAFYARETKRSFTYRVGTDERVADTFLDYLINTNNKLGLFVQNCEKDSCHTHIESIIAKLEDILPMVKNLSLINNTTDTLQEVLVDLIRFFKSYTTDMIGLNIVYLLDFKEDNLFRLIDRIDGIKKKLEIRDSLKLGYSDAIGRVFSTIKYDDRFKLRDKVNTLAILSLSDPLLLTDEVIVYRLSKYLDSLVLKDDLSIRKIDEVNENLLLSDAMEKVIISSKVKEYLFLKDEIQTYSTVNITPLEFSLFDSVRIKKKRIKYEDNCLLKDDCVVINRVER